MEKQKQIPVLQFPEFYGEWNKVGLGDICDNIMYGLNSAAIPYDGKHKYLRITDIDEKSREFNPNPLSSPLGKLSEEYKLKSGDIVFARTGASVGKSYLYKCSDGSLFFAGFLIKFSVKKADPYFVYTQTLRSNYHKWVTVMSMRSGQPGINAEEYKSYQFHIPPLLEQQKIASFFTVIDKKISQLKQKKSLLEKYKKGVMQKIFSQEFRFRDEKGQEFPKWEKIIFSQVYSFKVTNSLSRVNLNYGTGEVKNIHYGDIHTKFPTLLDVTREEVPYINSDITISKIGTDNYCKTNDLVFADASEDVEDVGKCIELINLNSERVLAGLHTILARPDTSKIANGFGGYLMKSHGVRKQIMKISQGSKVTSISSSRLGDIDLYIPCSKEQTKIANFLFSIDNKITYT